MTQNETESDTPALASATDSVLAEIKFNADGLVPAIAQQTITGEVLMLAWMNREAVEQTLKSGYAHYYSRSRKKLWRKGEESGQTQKIQDFRIDCDGDTVLMQVDQKGVACHTGRRNCFFRAPREGATLTDIHPVTVTPETLYGKGGDGS
jgi:phosphoribosyl-AMP cyclohydrolase